LVLELVRVMEDLTSQLLNNTPEFRLNMFKAVLRGHTLRILGGITDEQIAKTETQKLWGGIDNGTFVGKLGINFTSKKLHLGQHKYNPKPGKTHSMSTYDLEEGQLDIFYLGNSEEEKANLTKLVTQLIKFTLLLGGFGKSWRRIDHYLFYDQYFKNYEKPMIGCHWEFLAESASEKLYLTCNSPNMGNISKFLHDIRQNFADLLGLTNNNYARNWREVWHPHKVEVWAKISTSSQAVQWFHGNYANARTIKRTDLTGKINPTQVGRIWHRMYPRIVKKDGVVEILDQYVELLTIFPDDSDNTQQFLHFLDQSTKFIKIFYTGNELWV
jgi:CRISPR-associated protein Cmr6